MEKQELLKSIGSSLERGIITRDDLISFFDIEAKSDRSSSATGRLTLPEILYYLGGIIVSIGIAIFVGERWSILSSATKVLATFGAGIAMYVAGVLLSHYRGLDRPAIGLHLIAALLIPGGIFIFLDVLGILITIGLAALIFGALAALYLVSYLAYSKNLFLLFALLFGTGFYFLLTDSLLLNSESLLLFSPDFSLYRVLVLGLAYLSFGYAFSQENRSQPKAPSLIGLLNIAGIVCFLGAVFALSGFGPEKNIFWEIVFPGLALGAIFLSIEVRSRAYLVFGTLFLMGYIFKITDEYFSRSLGWPLSLILLGLAFIGIGYFSFTLNRKYLSR